jgi:hypothetical protein
VQRNEDVEDAVCSALVALGVMERSRFGRYLLLPRLELEPDVVELITTLGSSIPLRYFLRSEPRAAQALHVESYGRAVSPLQRRGVHANPRADADQQSRPCRHGREGDCPYCREHA